MRVLHVCSEIYPLLKTGGLADVAGALPLAQIRGGVDARVLVPGFPAIRAGVQDQVLVTETGGMRLYRGVLPGSVLPVPSFRSTKPPWPNWMQSAPVFASIAPRRPSTTGTRMRARHASVPAAGASW